jgi:RimJ/RimL family protein N-acetyltransferase
MNITIATPKITLRPWKLEDLPAFEQIHNKPDLADFTSSFDYPKPAGWAKERLEQMIASFGNDSYTFAVHGPNGGANIGLYLEHGSEQAELGYTCNQNWRNRETVMYAIRAVNRWAFANLEVNRIQAFHYPYDSAPGQVFKKGGLKCEGVQRGYLLKNGSCEDVIMYSLTQAAWLARHFVTADLE